MQKRKNLHTDGYNVWYDEGIDPGSEWDENIASHIDNCTFFIALLSKDYIESSNCRDELNYARTKEKQRLLVYLENVTLPSGMEMRLSRLQSIHKYKYLDEAVFYDKLKKSQGISECYSLKDGLENYYLLSNDGFEKRIKLTKGVHFAGKNKRKYDLVIIDDNYVSQIHAVINVTDQNVFIRDLNSMNGIVVNGIRIEPNVDVMLRIGDNMTLGRKEFVLCKEEPNGV